MTEKLILDNILLEGKIIEIFEKEDSKIAKLLLADNYLEIPLSPASDYHLYDQITIKASINYNDFINEVSDDV